MKCVDCKVDLYSLPIYNDGNVKFPESVLFCNNQDCSRFGLLTTVYVVEASGEKKSDKKTDKKSKRKKV